MLKRTIAAAATLIAFSQVAFANGGTVITAPTPPCTHSCYIGLGMSADVGYFNVNENVKWNGQNLINSSPFTKIFSNHWRQATSGVDAEGYIGYGWWMQDRFYLGGEFFGSVTANDGNRYVDIESRIPLPFVTAVNKQITSSRWSVLYNLGVSFVPGIKVNKTTELYARVGYEGAKFKLAEASSVSPISFITPFANTIPTHRYSKIKSGVQLGLGLEEMLTEHLSIRAEYDWNQYSTIHTTATGGFLQTGNFGQLATAVETNTISVKPTIHQFIVSFGYHFA